MPKDILQSNVPPTDLPPGASVEAGQSDESRPRQAELPPVELISSEDLEKRWLLASHALGLDPKVVYHPCSGNYKTPSVIFPAARVIYVEKDPRAVAAFQREGYEACEASATEFTPDVPVDLLILLNPVISSEHPASTVRNGGYVFTNNYHGNASQLKEDENFELVGVVVSDGDGYQFDQEHLEEYWQTVETDEEFKKARAGWTTVSFEYAQKVVQSLRPDATEVLPVYKQAIAEAREAYRRRISENLNLIENANASGVDLDPDKKTDFYVNGRILSANFPTKKGSTDDIYVFRRK